MGRVTREPVVPRPMSATAEAMPAGPDWAFELKWDGVRALAAIANGHARLFARSGAEITSAYPELAGLGTAVTRATGVTSVVLDGEIVLFDSDGRPSFAALAERIHVRQRRRAERLAAAHPVTYMIFDVIEVDGATMCRQTYAHRREWLDRLAAGWGEGGHWVVPPFFADGPATLAAATEMRLEGVVAKRLTSTYQPGRRSRDWRKIKPRNSGDYVVGGWRPGRRALGALLIGLYDEGGVLHYRGRVGSGISTVVERDLLARLARLRAVDSPFAEPVPRADASGATFVNPVIVVEVRYGEITRDGRLRFPSFLRTRPDKTPGETSDV